MKLLHLTIILCFLVIAGYSQSYTVQHFQSSYDTLVDYKSASIESGLAGENPYYWTRNFEFGFEFPFYDEIYEEVIMDSDAVGSFPESQDFNLFLFAGFYRVAEILDTSYLHSEMRYNTIAINDMQVLVIEFHNVFVDSEYEEQGENHFINFQTCFYENGIIEVRFGDIDLSDCSYYFPGQGFSFDNTDPTGELYGPWITISNNDLSEAACIFDDHTNPSITYDDIGNCGVLTSIPPEGYVIQFAPSTIASLEKTIAKTGNKFDIFQEDGLIEVKGELDFYKSCTIYDLMGRKIASSEKSKFSIATENPQIMVAVIESKNFQETHKFFVK